MSTVKPTEQPVPFSKILSDIPDPQDKKKAHAMLMSMNNDGDEALSLSPQEFFDAFYKRDGTYSEKDVSMCSTTESAERIIGEFPETDHLPDRDARAAVIIPWTNKYKILGNIADSAQRRFGRTPTDSNWVSVGQFCDARIITPKPKKEKEVQLATALEVVYEPLVEELSMAMQEIEAALAEVRERREDLYGAESGLYYAYREGYNALDATLKEVDLDLDALKGALAELDEVLDFYRDELDDETFDQLVHMYNAELDNMEAYELIYDQQQERLPNLLINDSDSVIETIEFHHEPLFIPAFHTFLIKTDYLETSTIFEGCSNELLLMEMEL